MRELLMGRRMLCQKTLEYYLLAEELGEQGENYGVGVSWAGDALCAVQAITPSQGKIMGLVCELMRCGVTPAALRDVVDDWLLC